MPGQYMYTTMKNPPLGNRRKTLVLLGHDPRSPIPQVTKLWDLDIQAEAFSYLSFPKVRFGPTPCDQTLAFQAHSLQIIL